MEDVQYDAVGRWYRAPSGAWYPSITTVLRVLSDAGIERWKQRVGREVAAEISKHACDRGTAVHAILEEFCLGNPIPPENEEAQWMAGQLMPIIKQRVGKVYLSESRLISHALKIAGRCDLVADFDGIPSIVDFKTAKKEKAEDWIVSYFCQECFYSVAAWQEHRIKATQIVTLIANDVDRPQVFVKQAADFYPMLKSVRARFSKIHGEEPRPALP